MPPATPAQQPSPGALLTSDLALPGLRRGKVRDIYDLPPDAKGRPRLLIVASDRISAFDVVMPTPIVGKGRLLTELSTFWLRMIESKGLCATHLLSGDVAHVPASAFSPGGTPPAALAGRIMVVRKTRVVPIECVARGYIEGSGWKEYQATGAICGVQLPTGLAQCQKLPEPIFTPATKEELGKHDENVTFERACAIAGRDVMETLRSTTLAIYAAAAAHALARGIIIADTKFEFGLPVDANGALTGEPPILIDEALTPDSSRFWPLDSYAPGRSQKSYDKQYLREYLESLVAGGVWGKQAPGPQLPPEIVEATLGKYREAMQRLTA
jgi:phosphoribosylaminoimidazole-succinocarboxamide synthase